MGGGDVPLQDIGRSASGKSRYAMHFQGCAGGLQCGTGRHGAIAHLIDKYRNTNYRSGRGSAMSRKAKKIKEREAGPDEIGSDPRQVGPGSAGQSGDTQGLPNLGEAAPESVEELVEDDQVYEAEVIEGVEEAGDHPEQPVPSHEDRRPAHDSELPPDPEWK
jgi:hypothetical protein